MKTKPTLQATKNGPYIVKNLENFYNSKKAKIDVKPMMALCRCGGSQNKPFCDGTHGKINFKDAKLPGREPDNRQEFKRGKITVSDNPGVCSHAGLCDGTLPKLFWDFEDGERKPKEREIDPEKAIKTIKLCPSGALAYKLDGKLFDVIERPAAITIRKDGPYEITGYPRFEDENDSKPDSQEHYTLCRCGASKNKPFCDGTHRSFFVDSKN